MSSLIAASPAPVPRDGVGPGSFTSGAAAAAPLVVGLVPFGLLVGTAVAASDDVLAAWTGTLLIYSGSI
jgi:predicted branched-subunit amino acid permease